MVLGTVAANVTVGFGTAALGGRCYEVVLEALAAGFRAFDTAEERDHWYNPKAVGAALEEYFVNVVNTNDDGDDALTDDECIMVDSTTGEGPSCLRAQQTKNTKSSSCSDLKITTKIPPWELTSAEHIRSNAAKSRQELVGFCDDPETGTIMPLDSYLIHAPACWKGWHTKCENPPPTLDLRSVWLALEAVVGLDGSARRIGLSNVHPPQLLDIIQFVQERTQQQQQQQQPAAAGGTTTTTTTAPPRMPDVVQIYADPIRPADEMRRICQEHGIEFVSYSTLGSQHRMATGQNPVLSSPTVHALAEKHGRSTAEVVLSWALQKGMSVIPRSSQRQHIRELARLLPTQQQQPAEGGAAAAAAVPTVFLDADDLRQMDALKNSA